eukprot:scaffold4062_cov137-Cylindrotheca_fusiformis.AAC.13
MSEQKEGCYPRLNGAMIQSQQYNATIVSVVGKLIDNSTLQAADGTNINLGTDYLQDGLVHNPDMCVEVIGQVIDATSMTVRAPSLESLDGCFVIFLTLCCHFVSEGVCDQRTFHRYGFRLVQSDDCHSAVTRLFLLLPSSFC